jgi:hypothetical protein
MQTFAFVKLAGVRFELISTTRRASFVTLIDGTD